VRRGIARRLAPLVMVVAVLAGCTGEPAPTTTPLTFEPYTPTATPTPEPDPDEATVPPERPDLSQVDAETAEALAVYFLQLYPYVYATGDLTDWRALSHPECIFCASVIGNVEKMHAAGNHSEGGLVAVGEVEALQATDHAWLLQFSMVQEPSATLNSTGDVVEDFPERKTYDVDMALDSSTGRFLVLEVTPHVRST